jgi:hypothetical protein
MAFLQELIEQRRKGMRRVEDEERRFGQVNERLETGGQFNERIAAAAYELIESGDWHMTREETLFTLRHGRRGKPKGKIKDKVRARLDEATAVEYFVGEGIYPADAVGWMPEVARAEVREQLLRKERQPERIPDIFVSEADDCTDEERARLLDIAVKRSADLPGGLLAWQGHLKGLSETERSAIQQQALHRVSPSDAGSIADYLLLVDDPGGAQLSENRPAFREAQNLREFVGLVIGECRENLELELAQRSKQWLKGLVESDLRPSIGLDQKDEIAALVKDGWRSYERLRQAFKGVARKGTRTPQAEPWEREFLSAELSEIGRHTPGPRTDFIPDLAELAGLLGPGHFKAIVDSAAHLEPTLDGPGGAEWVEGWRDFSEGAAEDEGERQRCHAKYQAELVRLLLQTNAPLKEPKALTALDGDQLERLFEGLLWGGDDDAHHRKRLLELLRAVRGSAEARDAFSRAFGRTVEAGEHRSAFARRFGEDDSARKLISEWVGERGAATFDDVLREQASEKFEETRKTLVTALSSGQHDSRHDAALATVKRWAGDKVFEEALAAAFELVMSNEAKRGAFLSGCVANEHCLAIIRQGLRKEHKSKLVELGKEKKQLDRAHLIRGYIYGATTAQPTSCGDNLINILKSKGESAAGDAAIVEEAVSYALSAPDLRNAMYSRLVTISDIHKYGQTERRVNVRNVALNLIFKVLKPETQFDFLYNLWESYGGEDESNPLTRTCHDVFNRLKQSRDDGRAKARPKGTAKKGVPPEGAFEESILRFIAENEPLKRQVGRRQLGADRAGQIDDYLGPYASHGAKQRAQPAGPEANVVDMDKSYFGKFKRKLFKPFTGKSAEEKKDAEPEDEKR